MYMMRSNRILKMTSAQKKDFITKIAICFVIVIFSCILANHRASSPQLDVFDEGAHLDYALSLSHGMSPSWNTKLSQETLLMVDCGGRFGQPALPCVQKNRNPSLYGASGYSYEAQQPPLGYLPYSFAAKLVKLGKPVEYLKDIRRIGGYFWIALAGCALLLLANKLKVNARDSIVFFAIPLLAPTFVNSTGTINNDSSALFSGTVLLILLFNTQLKSRYFFLIGLALGFTKILYVIPAFAIYLALLIEKRLKIDAKAKKDVLNRNEDLLFDKRNLITVIFGGLSSAVIWMVIQSLRSTVSSKAVQDTLFGFMSQSRPHLNTVVTGIFTNFQVTNSYNGSPWFGLATILILSATIGKVIYSKKGSLEFTLSLGFIVAILTIGIGWNLLFDLLYHFNTGSAARYLIVCLPFLSVIVTKTNLLNKVTISTLLFIGSVLWLITPIG